MHFLLCKIIIILTLIMPITAYADVPTLEGEDLFNQTVERSMTCLLYTSDAADD